MASPSQIASIRRRAPDFQPDDPSHWAYYAIPSPSTTFPPLVPTLIQPALRKLSLLRPEEDPTYHRFDLPWSPREKEIADEQKYTVEGWLVGLKDSGNPTGEGPRIQRVGQGVKVFGDGGTGKGLARGKRWVHYQIYENKKAVADAGHYSSMVFVHGINDYGGKFAEHATFFLDRGYRLILPDHPNHGRSTGLHVYLDDLDELLDALHFVITDVGERDQREKRLPNTHVEDKAKGRTFMSGASLGGWTVLAYLARYPTLPEPLLPIAGVIALCPMLGIQPQSRPSYLVELVARGLSSFAGRIEMAEANRGRNSEDPAVEQEFEIDPQTYHGKLKIATGLSILRSLSLTAPTLPSSQLFRIAIPTLLIHGKSDRVTSWKNTELLFKGMDSEDKELQLLEGYEHIILRRGKKGVPGDDDKRFRVIDMMLSWLDKHTTGTEAW